MSIAHPDKPDYYAPLAKHAPARPRTARPPFKITIKMVKYTAGIVGVGLWVVGWRFFDSAGLGLVGLCVMGITAIIIAIISDGGMGVRPQAAERPAPAPAIYDMWRGLSAEEKARAWPRLTDVEKIEVVGHVYKEWQKR